MPRLDPQALVTHLDRLYRVAWALCGSREEAEDLVQETAARVLARPRQLRGQDELAYLVQALRNTFLLSRRTRSRRPRETATLDQIEPADPRAQADGEAVLRAHELLDAIAGLPDDFREAIVAVDVAGLSYREAARMLGTREATIASRVFRARERVARAVVGEDPHPPRQAPQARGEGAGAPRSLR